MKYQLIIRPEAELDLVEAFQWYEEQSPGLGGEFLRCIDASFDIIIRSPGLYQKVYKDIRRALPQRFPYGIFYIIDDNDLIVLAILHAKRDPKLLKEIRSKKED